LIDIYLDELEKFYPGSDDTQAKKTSPPIRLLMKPFEILVVQSPTKVIRTRVKDLMADERLQNWGYQDGDTTISEPGEGGQSQASKGHDGNGEDEEEEWTGFDD